MEPTYSGPGAVKGDNIDWLRLVERGGIAGAVQRLRELAGAIQCLRDLGTQSEPNGGSIAARTSAYDTEAQLLDHFGFAGAIQHSREIAGVFDACVDKVLQ